jgi:hypothetical protein
MSMGGRYRRFPLTGSALSLTIQIEVKGTSIDIRTDAGPDEEARKQRATEVVENLIRAIGLQERTHYTARFASMAKFDELKQTRSITVLCEPARLRISGGHVDSKVPNADGMVMRNGCKLNQSIFRDDRLSAFILQSHAPRHRNDSIRPQISQGML